MPRSKATKTTQLRTPAKKTTRSCTLADKAAQPHAAETAKEKTTTQTWVSLLLDRGCTRERPGCDSVLHFEVQGRDSTGGIQTRVMCAASLEDYASYAPYMRQNDGTTVPYPCMASPTVPRVDLPPTALQPRRAPRAIYIRVYAKCECGGDASCVSGITMALPCGEHARALDRRVYAPLWERIGVEFLLGAAPVSYYPA